MNLVHLIYASRLSKDCNRVALERILEVSRKNNRELGVTGALCYSPQGFLQIIEGPAKVVNQLYNRIVLDSRHVDVTLIRYAEIQQRDFEDWSMAYVRSDEIDESLLRKYSTHHDFDPYSMKAEQALGFLKAITQERKSYLKRQQRVMKARRT